MNTRKTEYHFASFAYPRYQWSLPHGSYKNGMRKQPSGYILSPGTSPSPDLGFYLIPDHSKDGGCPFSLRWSWCDEVEGTRIRHTGWFCDEWQDEKIRGLVFTLPRGRGFLAGWSMGESMISLVERYVYESATDAARAADSMAEKAADEEREYQEKAEAERQAEEEAELESALCSAE